MKQIPLSLVAAFIILVAAEWPSIQGWSEVSAANHYLAHLLYLVAGWLVGWQTSRWVEHPAGLRAQEAGVSS